jgi:response regulator RpfG family c-di-GMP phosphodiesterase
MEKLVNKRLLIVDDDIDIVGIIFDFLTDLFDSIDVAYSVEEAIALLAQYSYAIILLDINLQNRNGAEVVKYIKENADNMNKTASIVIVSGIMTPQFKDIYADRFAGLLMKPFDESELTKIVRDLLIAKNLLSENDLVHEAAPVEVESGDDIPKVKCIGPFPIAELEIKVEQVMKQIAKSAKLKQLFKFLKIDRNASSYVPAHIGLIINISSAICEKMDWNSSKTLEKFVYAAYLHDMSLAHRPDLAHITTILKLEAQGETLSKEDYDLIFEHPNTAANLIFEMDEIPPDVDVMIRQHHELPHESGFPEKCALQKITALSAVFIVAHHLADYIIENTHWKMEDFIAVNKDKLHGSHFTKIMRLLVDLK